ncbi:hypothetical protein ACLQ3H_18290 [Micromonospora saelicesensis]|uniref:hypothetical protein n=1 Tax=Micromonospora saelicesensis TaxID=285676 RepID=UPI0021ACB309|nr:hypothetical protein [Micromonospora saelicesensis]
MENTLHCTKCGAELAHPGQGHMCRSSTPPPALRTAGWNVATWFVVGFAILYALAAIAAAVLGSTPSGRARPLPPSGAGAPIGLVLANLILIAALIGLAISGLIWGRGTRQLAEAHGSSGRSYSRHWGIRVFSSCIVFSTLMAWLATDRTAPAVLFGQAGLRTLGAAALIGGVLHSRARVLRLIAQVDRVVAGHSSPVAGQDPAWPLSPIPTSDDWNASQWDPDVLRDIEARRNRDRT